MKRMVAFALGMSMVLTAVPVMAADEEVTLTVMNVQSSDDETYNQLLAEFEEQYQHIKVEHISTVNAELKKQIKIDMLAGNMPDIVQFDNPDFASFAASGYLMDITDLVGRNADIL